MKVNEVPEKIYCGNNGHGNLSYSNLLFPNAVEYTRTDAFIEKALKWYCLDCECNDNCKDTKCFFYREYERYLKGGTNALPPKFSDKILNEDGSTSDNWRYRHFIAKIQDAFIEKACEWIKENITNNPNANSVLVRNGCVTLGMLVDDFKKYMEE